MVGTDGKHLFTANTFQFELPRSVIIPNRKFLHWSGFAQDGEWRVGVTPEPESPGWLLLQSDHWRCITKAIAGQYPNWRPVVPPETRPQTVVTLEAAAIALMLDVLPRLPGANDPLQPVDLIVTNGQLALAADQPDFRPVPVPGATVAGADTLYCGPPETSN